MRKEFIACVDRRTAVRRAHWAAEIIRVDGGFMAFESAEDARVWRSQK